MAKWLAGVAARDDVHGLHGGEVQLGHVAVVRYAGEVVVKDAGRGLVVLDVPCDLAAEDGLNCEVKPPVAAEQRADPHLASVGHFSDNALGACG